MVVAYVSQLPNESTYSLGISYLRTVACSDVYHTMWDESSDCESEFPTNKIVFYCSGANDSCCVLVLNFPCQEVYLTCLSHVEERSAWTVMCACSIRYQAARSSFDESGNAPTGSGTLPPSQWLHSLR